MPGSRLDSWKSIASYLGRGLRTVQRWHVEYGMPVHHFGGTKGSVFAYTEDLDSWLLESGDVSGARDGGEHPVVEMKKARSRELTASADAMWESRSERNLTSIIRLYREAVDEDPGNLAALTGLSRSLIAGALLGVVDSSVAYPSAAEALRRVPLENCGETEALCTAAWLKMVYERRWREARAGFDQVLSKEPGDSFAFSGRALLYVAEGKIPEALDCASEAWKRNPLAAPLNFLTSWIEYLDGNAEGSLELVEEAKASGGYGASHAVVEALALTQTAPIGSSPSRIEEIAGEFPQSRVLQGILGYSYARSGHPGKAWELLGSLMQLSERKKRNSSYLFALVLLGLGEKQEVCAFLDSSFDEGSLWSLGFRSDPLLAPLRGDPHFESLLRRIGPSPRGNDLLAADASHDFHGSFAVGGSGRCSASHQSAAANSAGKEAGLPVIALLGEEEHKADFCDEDRDAELARNSRSNTPGKPPSSSS